MALPADFSKIFGSTFTGGLVPISDVNYLKGWEYVGSNPPTKNDFSYLQNQSDIKSKWLYDNNNGRKIGEQWFKTSGTYTPTAGTKRIKIIITGGGGGGGGAFNAGGVNDNFSGAGGAAGSTGIKWFNISDVSNFSVVIGAGGTEAVKGGNSTFSGVTAVGGNPSQASTVFASGGLGVAGTGADTNIAGGDGGDGQNGTRLLNGTGGASFWGGGRRSGQASVGAPVMSAATIPGGGGGGAYDTQILSTRFYGGNGASGICVIEEYS